MTFVQVTGKIIHLSEITRRETSRGVWEKQTVVVEIPGRNNTFSRLAVTADGNSVQNLAQFKVGDAVNIAAFISCHEWQGRWYNDVELSSIVAADNNPRKAEPKKAEPVTAKDDEDEDLPF